MWPLTRRRFLLGAGAAAVLAACGDDGGSAGPATTAGPSETPPSPGAEGPDLVLGAAFDRNHLLVTGIPQRAPFLLFESSGGLVTPADAPGELEFVIVPPGGEALPPLVVGRHGDGIDRPYWPLETTFSEPGLHTATVQVEGRRLEFAFNVSDPTGVRVPQVGEPLPSAPTPTVAAPMGVQTVCTASPPCPLHETSLDEALAAGRPVALLVSTPAYCQVAICGPVLDLLVGAAADHPGVAAIHLEVYPDGEPSEDNVSPVVVDTLGLGYEPVLFVAGAGGAVTARLDNIYDGDELAVALGSAG